MAKRPPLKAYAEADIPSRLTGELRQWRLDRGAICRTYRTTGWKATMMAANAIAHLAEQAWHHPELRLTYPALDVRLDTHEAGGVTDRDFELAARIEALMTWQASGALEGAPAQEAILVGG